MANILLSIKVIRPSKIQAFSLIELAIVMLIIGILIAGITGSSRLIAQFRLSTAKTITQSAPVWSIKNLESWYETTLDESFIDIEAEDGSTISTWNDINVQKINRDNATQSSASSRPLYVANVFNNAIPAVRFDGSNDFFSIDGQYLVGNPYTIFAIERRLSPTGAQDMYLGADGVSLDRNIALGYNASDSSYRFSHYANGIQITAPSYSTPIVKMHTHMLSVTAGKSYWENGGTTPDVTGSSQTATLISLTTPYIAKKIASTTQYYHGDLAELIIYSRALNTEERQSIEDYLSKKYNIAIN